MSKTKIVCTIGPSSSSPDIIKKLILNGMNVARLNFSHGTHQEHFEKINLIRKISKEIGKPVAILQDICGPKIRVGSLLNDIELIPDDTVFLTSKKTDKEKHIPVSYAALYKFVKKDDSILLADGTMKLCVVECRKDLIVCKVINGGVLTSFKGINLPSKSGSLKFSAITEKDKKDIAFGVKNELDFIAISFVRDKKDIDEARKIIKKAKKDIPLIAKIEKNEAILNFEEILKVSDGIMIARGDLGVEIDIEEVPIIQKKLIRETNRKGKPVIVATQMLKSMETSPIPTRAEATDIANAVWDGADGVMLSEETAKGKYPVEAVTYMHKILKATEGNYPHRKYLEVMPKEGIAENVAHSACELSSDLNAKIIIVFTASGYTASLISKFRPKAKIIAFTPNKKVLQTLTIYWGCSVFLLKFGNSFNSIVKSASKEILKKKIANKDDLVIITAGTPFGKKGSTNMVKVIKL